jgi:ABC-type Zn uptake system ZnuABC Zn-binding protein ZnuA
MAMLAVSCAPGREDVDGGSTVQRRPVVVATNAVVQSIVRLVGGDAFDVRSLVPDSKDPHDFEPSASDIAVLDGAGLIVQVGLGYEHGVENVVERAVGAGVPVLTLTNHVPVVGGDPHVFTDPLTVSDAVDEIASALADLAPLDQGAAVARVRGVLARADAVARDRLAPLTSKGGCVLVTDHDALAYFARRFGCEVAGVVTRSFASTAEASAAQVQRLVDGVEESRGRSGEIRAVFVERGSSAAVAEKISELTGIKVVELAVHSLPPDNTYETYVVELAHTILKGLTS